MAEALDRRLAAPLLPCRPGAGDPLPPAVWHIPVVLAAYTDEDLTFSAADFDSGLFGNRGNVSGGSVRDYWRWVSGGRLQITGRVVGTVRLPHALDFYGDNTWGFPGRQQNSVFGAVKDALALCERSVDWSEFDLDHDGLVDILWFVHSGKGGEASPNDPRRLWSLTDCLSRQTGQFGGPFKTSQLLPGSSSAYYTINFFASLPEISGINPTVRSEIGVFCHEFGHALGLPDLYDTAALGTVANYGPGNWSLMSTGAYGGNGLQPELPTHPGGWASSRLGWTQVLRPTRDTTLVIPPLANGGPVVEFWFQGESNPEHFLLENRVRQAFDFSLPKAGMIVTHVDDALIEARLPGNAVNKAGSTPGYILVEGDGDFDMMVARNKGDRWDPFPGDSLRTRFDDETIPGTRTFGNAVTNISLSGIELVGSDVRVNLQVEAPGWLATEDHTQPPYQPLTSSSSAGNLAVLDPSGSVDAVSCEFRAGRPQVVLHRRTAAGWEPGLELSASPSSATTPAIAALPGGNAAVVWSDTRGGRARIWVRVRLEGQWSAERVLADVPGQNQTPAVGADAHGRVYVTWLNIQNGVPRLYFTRFVYFAPFGQPLPVTAVDRQPGNPAIAVDPDGFSYIMWPDAADNPQRFWFARFNPDSGLSQAQPLTATAGAETGMSAVVDDEGTLHLAWQVSVLGRNEIHYQRRFKTRRPAPRDTALAIDVSVGNPRLGLDPTGSVHLVYESTADEGQQVFYKRCRPNSGWDFQGTQVSSSADGTAGAPQVVATSSGNLSVLYTGFNVDGPRFMERRRMLDPPIQPVVLPVATSLPAPLSLWPNPMRAGQEFELEWSGAPPEPGASAELFDVAGRVVAAAAIEPRGTSWRARFSGALTSSLPSGIYFARPGVRGIPARRLVVLR